MKMGYTPGEGLGRNKQGISRPIEAALRAKGAGLGHGGAEKPLAPAGDRERRRGEERSAKAAASEAEAEETDLDIARAREVQRKQWRKTQASERGPCNRGVVPVRFHGGVSCWLLQGPPKPKRQYRTAEDLLREREAQQGPGAKPAAAAAPAGVTIIDMRGPQARILKADEGEPAAGAEVGVPMPELQHNLRLLVDLTESDIARLDGRLRQETDTLAVLEQEERRLKASGEPGVRTALEGSAQRFPPHPLWACRSCPWSRRRTSAEPVP